MRGWRRSFVGCVTTFVAAAGALGMACSFDSGTISGYLPSSGGGDALADAVSSDGGPAGDGSSVLADGAPDPFDAACGTAFASGAAVAYPSAKTKVLDGVDDDWGCERPFVLDATSAAAKHSADGGYEGTAACKFEWTAAEVYVFCDVTDPTPGEGVDSNPTNNDALEVYISGTPVSSRTGNYGFFDHQYAVDYRNTKAEFAGSQKISSSPGPFTTFVRTHAGGYAVEASVDAGALVTGSLTATTALGFDLDVDDGAGQLAAILWFQATHGVSCGTCTSIAGFECCCSGATNGPGTGDLPFCDALAFGTLLLHP